MRLRLLPRSEGEALTNGLGAPPVGLAWDPDYPTEDTLVALGLLRLAHDAAGFESAEQPRWWLYQIVVGETGQDLIVGDIGFHGPPGPGARAVVEIGYYVVPGWRGLGVATRACASCWSRRGGTARMSYGRRPSPPTHERSCWPAASQNCPTPTGSR